MKKLIIISLLFLFLCGCAKETEFETISDVDSYPSNEPSEVTFILPEEASVQTMEDGDGNHIYICENYCVETYTFPSGDIGDTIQKVSGFAKDDITVLKRENGDIKRYECTWSSAGEGDLQVCRASVLDDGNFHYVLSASGNQLSVSSFEDQWQSMFSSYSIKDA